MMIKPGEEIQVNGGQRIRVLTVVPFEEEDELPFVAMLQVESPSHWLRTELLQRWSVKLHAPGTPEREV